MGHILQRQSVRSIPDLLRIRVDETPETIALRYPVAGSWQTLTWRELLQRVLRVAAGLRSLGVAREDRIALLCSTRAEWVIADLGILAAGGATTTIYPSSLADECAYIIADSDARIVIVENTDQLAKIREVADQIRQVMTIVLIEGVADGTLSFERLAELGDADAMGEVINGIEPQQLATLIYTSGTTGQPKGVELTHDNWLFAAEGASRIDILHPDDVHFLWLPLSHSFGKVLEVLMIDAGVETAIDGRVDKIVDNLPIIRPTLMAAAPRIFEKVYNVAVSSVKAEGGLKWAIFRRAVKVGIDAVRLQQRGEKPGRLAALQYAVADRLVFSKLRARFGGRVRFFISGSAPLAPGLAEFFAAAGMTILEGYGLTESSASTFVNPPEAPRFGTVGPPIPDTEVRIAEDGEVLIRSRAIMRGYHGLPEETAAALRGGWLHTGDVGELDDGGYLRITDRKKELIKTSGGNYVAPAKLEGLIKTASPYISNVLVHGDRRKYCVALVTLDADAVAHWAENNKVPGDPTAIARHPEMIDLIESSVDDVNRVLPSFETIKKVTILPAEFEVETGELTPSLKLRRHVIEQRYAVVLDAMYESEPAP